MLHKLLLIWDSLFFVVLKMHNQDEYACTFWEGLVSLNVRDCVLESYILLDVFRMSAKRINLFQIFEQYCIINLHVSLTF